MNSYSAWLFFLAILIWAISRHAISSEIYTWEDENGNLHYGDKAAINQIDASINKIRVVKSKSAKPSFAMLSDPEDQQFSMSSSLPLAKTYNQVTANQDKVVLSKPDRSKQRTTVQENEEINPAVSKLLDLAKQHSQAGQLARAAAIVERALRLQSDYSKSWQHLAKIYHQQGHYEQAYFLKQKAIQIAGY